MHTKALQLSDRRGSPGGAEQLLGRLEEIDLIV
jgi:hypothetical protein